VATLPKLSEGALASSTHIPLAWTIMEGSQAGDHSTPGKRDIIETHRHWAPSESFKKLHNRRDRQVLDFGFFESELTRQSRDKRLERRGMVGRSPRYFRPKHNIGLSCLASLRRDRS
jgi:hypothetical protein